MTIVPKLYGRYGNQLFQICCAIGYAKRHNIDYCIPKLTIDPKAYKPYFAYLSKCENEIVNPVLLRETEHSYNRLPSPIEGNDIILDGYWQSSIYWNDYIHEIRSILGFNYSTQLGLTACHWRFGDYRLYPTKHPIATEKYMTESIDYLVSKGYRNFIFFSDEIEECKLFVSKYYSVRPDISISFSEGKSEHEDFEFMMRCQNQIISNSTFSLMAALLNAYPEKIVVSPTSGDWFGVDNKHLSTKDLLPESFIKIKH